MAIIIPNLERPPYPCTPDTDPHWFDDRGMQRAAMQLVVGGRLQYRALYPPLELGGALYPHMVVNEAGKHLGLPANHEASLLYSRLEGALVVIAGPAILLTADEYA